MKINKKMAAKLGMSLEFEELECLRLKADWEAAVHHYCCSFGHKINELNATIAKLEISLKSLQQLRIELIAIRAVESLLYSNTLREIEAIERILQERRHQVAGLRKLFNTQSLVDWWTLISLDRPLSANAALMARIGRLEGPPVP